MQEIKKLINILDKSTRRALIKDQLCSIPIKYYLQKTKNIIYEYRHIKNTLYSFNNTNEIIFKNPNIRNNIHDYILNIDKNICKDIIFFDNDNLFVPLSKIKTIISDRRIYFYTEENIELKIAYICQTNIDYKENLTKYTNEYPLFIYEGKIYNEYIKNSIGINFNLYTEYGYLNNNFIISNIEKDYNIFKENIFLLKDNILQDNIDYDESICNIFSIKSDIELSNINYFILYSKEEKSIDNIVRYTKYLNIVKDILNNVNLPNYIDYISDDFNFEYDILDENNIERVIKDILEYTHKNLDILFSENNDYITKEFKGSYVLSKLQNNIFTIPRLRNKYNSNLNTYVIVYHNGELLKSYDNIKYIGNNILIPINETSIKNDDILEVVYYRDVMNNEFTTNIPINGEFNYSYLASIPSDVNFFSHLLDNNHLFKIEENENRKYILPYRYSISNNSSNIVNILFDDRFYHDKDIIAASKRQFRHTKYTIPKDNKSTLKIKYYNIEKYIQNNGLIINSNQLDDICTIDTDGVDIGGEFILENKSLSFSNKQNDIYIHNIPTNIDINSYSFKIYSYVFLDEYGEYEFNLLSRGSAKIKIDDTDYCVDISGQNTNYNIDDSTNKVKVYLNKGFHKLEIITYKTPGYDIGVSLYIKEPRGVSYTPISIDKIYNTEPTLNILKLENSIFKYCRNTGQYICFYNGRRLTSEEIILKFMGYDQVYDSNYMIINRQIEEESTIDIFYVPDPVREVYNQFILKENGYIDIEDKFKLYHTFTPEFCAVFVNGKKIPSSKMTNVNATKIRIDTDIETIYNVTVIKTNVYDNLLGDLFLSYDDLWTTATNMMTDKQLDEMLGSMNNISMVEDDNCLLLYDYNIIKWNIVNNFWIKRFNMINANSLFVYNDDETVLYKQKNNIRKYVSDNNIYNKSDNIKVDKYEENGYEIYEFTNTTDEEGYIEISIFENVVIDYPQSIGINILSGLDYKSQYQNRFFVRLYNLYNPLMYKDVQMSYLDIHNVQLSEIPKCYWLRLYYNNLPTNSDYDCIKVRIYFHHYDEYIRIYKSVLEESVCCTEGIDIIPIDPNIKTGCELPY